jgi:anti-sigma B factor antagonist
MSWLLNTREVEGVTIVDVQSFSILLHDKYKTLKEATDELLKKGKKKILINLANVGYIDSFGIGDLVDCFGTAKLYSAQFKLLHVQKKVRDLLLSTRLLGVFEIFDDEEDAVRSFQEH